MPPQDKCERPDRKPSRPAASTVPAQKRDKILQCGLEISSLERQTADNIDAFIEEENIAKMTIIRQLPRDMSALCGKADDAEPQLLSGWCCGATDTDASGEIDAQSESKSSDTNSMVNSEGTRTAALGKSRNNARYPPIVFSPVDESKLTMAKQRSIADRSFAESTFVDDNVEGDLYKIIAGIIGSSPLASNAAKLGDKIALGMGYGKEDMTSTSGSDQTSSTEASPKASATRRASKDDADDDTSFNSSFTNLFPTWVAFSDEADEAKLAINEKIEIKPKKKRNKLTNFLFKRKKKSAFVASPTGSSTAASTMSSIGMYTAWGDK